VQFKTYWIKSSHMQLLWFSIFHWNMLAMLQSFHA
jgi:hypothetical protein